MRLALDYPLALWLLPLMLLPLCASALRGSGYPSLLAVPRDRLAFLIGLAVKMAGALAIGAIVLALGGLHRVGPLIERTGAGARIVLLIDRSSSMNDSFANRQPSAREQSKSAVARRLLAEFIRRRPRDRIGVATFSTSAMPVLPPTDHHELVQAAIAAIDKPGLALTNVGLGLALAISMLSERGAQSPGAIVLVSDGASVISPRVQATLREMAARSPFNLYWLFLRSEGSPGIFRAADTPEQDTPYTHPERHLHLFLGTLGIPYRAFEADSARAVEQAVAEIDRQESRPMRYFERAPSRDLRPPAFGVALGCVVLLALAKLAERPLYAPR